MNYDRREYENNRRLKITLLTIFVIVMIFVFYNVLITELNSTTTGDRRNYALNFYGVRTSPSLGLTAIINFVRYFSSNVEILFYVTTFITVLVTLIAYRINQEADYNTLLFLLSTQYIYFAFEGLKQGYTNAFAALCIVLTLRNKGTKDLMLSILTILLAIWFHHSGYFLVPLIIMLRIKKTRKNVVWFFVIMIILIIFLEPVLLRFASLVSSVFPPLSRAIRQYIGETASEGLKTEGSLMIIKGFPFYIITAVGFNKREQLVAKVKNYDNYLFISGVISFIYLSTVYNGWLYRIAYLLYLPVGVFYGVLLNSINNKNNRIIFGCATLGVTALLTIRFVILMYINYGGF